MIFQNNEGSLVGKAMMDRAIVQYQYQWSFASMLLREMVQESNEGFAVALFCYLINDFVCHPVVGTKEMTPLLLSWSGNSLLAASLHPASDQNWQPA